MLKSVPFGSDGKPIYPPCPDGSGGLASAKCTVACRCAAFGVVVEIPDGPTTTQYNFTWHGTALPPNTADTGAYQDYLNRLGQ